MFKFFKILIVNIILLFLLYNVADFVASLNSEYLSWFYTKNGGNKLVTYFKYYYQLHNYNIACYKNADPSFDELLTVKHCQRGEIDSEKFRPIENENSDKSIAIFGCSFAYGDHLKDDGTLSAYMGKILPNYRIYNRAKCGWSTSHMLYQLENADLSYMQNVKLVVYVFIEDHFIRNYNSYITKYTPYYAVDKNKRFGIQKYSFKYVRTPLTYLYKTKVHDDYYKSNKDTQRDKYDLTKAIIQNAKFNVELEFPEAKFVVLRCDSGDGYYSYDYMFKELKREGVDVVSLADLTSVDMTSPEYIYSDFHPTSRAWSVVTPAFVKYLQNQGYLNN